MPIVAPATAAAVDDRTNEERDRRDDDKVDSPSERGNTRAHARERRMSANTPNVGNIFPVLISFCNVFIAVTPPSLSRARHERDDDAADVRRRNLAGIPEGALRPRTHARLIRDRNAYGYGENFLNNDCGEKLARFLHRSEMPRREVLAGATISAESSTVRPERWSRS